MTGRVEVLHVTVPIYSTIATRQQKEGSRGDANHERRMQGDHYYKKSPDRTVLLRSFPLYVSFALQYNHVLSCFGRD